MQLASCAKEDRCVQLQKRRRRNPRASSCKWSFSFAFYIFSPHKTKKAKSRRSFLLPWQLFTAVYSCAALSSSERGRRAAFLCSCLAARQLIVAVGPLTSCLVMCFQLHFYAVPGHKYPLRQTHKTYFWKYLEGEETVTRQIYCWFFFLFRYVNKMPFWFKETWTRECLDTTAIIPWSWPHVSFCINEGSSLFAPARQQHNQQAIKF